MIDLLKFDVSKMTPFKRQPGSSLLGLSFDTGRLELVWLRRTNGHVEVRHTAAVSLSLDPLTDDPQLVGREIRKHLDAAEVRERWCVVCVPLSWMLSHFTPVPELEGPDLDSFLQIEAERGFPYSPETLMRCTSHYATPGGEKYATLLGIPRDHVTRLEAALKAAQLRPVSFSLGIVALQQTDAESAASSIALVPGENHIGLLVAGEGGVAALRTVEGAFEVVGAEKHVQADHLAREVRITLGQLPAELRGTLRTLRVFGRSDVAEELAEQLQSRMKPLGMEVELVRDCKPQGLGVQVAAGTPVSPALSLALEFLAGRTTGFEFLPPKISAWKQFADKYASRKLTSVGFTAGAIVLLFGLVLLFQQWQLVRWRSKWAAIKTPVTELETMQQQIKKFRPWFDESCRSLSILRQLTEAFPEDGAVAAKTVEIRAASTISCSGTARDNQVLLRTLDKLGTAPEVNDVQLETIRGKSPIQFTFNFQWGGQGNR